MVSSSFANLLLALLVGAASASPTPQDYSSAPSYGSWDLQKFTSLVAFGDSYTDESQLAYFIATGGLAPPLGWIGPEVLVIRACLRVKNRSHSLDRAIQPPPAAVSGLDTWQTTLEQTYTTMLCQAPSAPTSRWIAT